MSGAAMGAYSSLLVLQKTNMQLDQWPQVGVMAGCGLVIGLLFLFFIKAGFFVIGALPGCLGGNLAFQLIASNTDYRSDGVHIACVIVCGLLAGILNVFFFQRLFRLLTAFAGGYVRDVDVHMCMCA
jgi:hypothetical protein